MRVKLSTEARQDVQRQVDYLSGKTVAGIASFREIIKRAQRQLSSHPRSGQTETQLPLRGAMRIIIEGWYFDYEIFDDVVWVHRITSSVNTPSLKYDDDEDYEVSMRTADDQGDE